MQLIIRFYKLEYVIKIIIAVAHQNCIVQRWLYIPTKIPNSNLLLNIFSLIGVVWLEHISLAHVFGNAK